MLNLLRWLAFWAAFSAFRVPADETTPLPQLTIQQKFTVIALAWQQQQQQGLADYCRLWAMKFREAYRLDDKQWAEFVKKGPRHLGRGKPWDVEFDEEAADYEKEAKRLQDRMLALAKHWCGEKNGISIEVNRGEVSPDGIGCVSWGR